MVLHVDPTGKERLGALAPTVESVLGDLIARGAAARIWAGDHTLWQDDPTEVADRLGWLHVVPEMAQQTATIEAFATEITDAGFTHVVVMGMGGSSLFPEVIARTFGAGHHRQGLELVVLDTTDPAAVRRVAETCPLDTTLFVASSKSGSTIETRSHLAYFWDLVGKPEQFVVVTDPGSELGALARERGFRTVFENRADIGGRYSALSFFGLVPAALAGVDLDSLLAPAQAMLDELRVDDDLGLRLGLRAGLLSDADLETGAATAGAADAYADVAAVLADDTDDGTRTETDDDDEPYDPFQHPGVRLGAILAAGVISGLDKLTLIIPDDVASFGLWLEQLLAESTGKHETGIVPVVGEPLAAPALYGPDRIFVSLGGNPALDALAAAGHPVVELPFDGPESIGAHVVLWEFATAVCGAALDINPFDQPNVAEAKSATTNVLEAGELPVIGHEALDVVLDQIQPGDYLAIQAFVDPESPLVEHLDAAREALRDRFMVATTLGLGPRYLHSTGQLHKGGPPTGVFIQVVGDDPDDCDVPGETFSFSRLKQAQAAGDLQALRQRGLRVARVALDELVELGEAARP